MEVSLKVCVSTTFYILLFCTGFTSGNVSIDDEFIVVDGIRVRKSDQIRVRSEQHMKEEQARIKYTLDGEDARLYNESEEITKNLPNKCQGLSMNDCCSLQ
jgi:hypothetical protein